MSATTVVLHRSRREVSVSIRRIIVVAAVLSALLGLTLVFSPAAHATEEVPCTSSTLALSVPFDPEGVKCYDGFGGPETIGEAITINGISAGQTSGYVTPAEGGEIYFSAGDPPRNLPFTDIVNIHINPPVAAR
jgi:hypothetical protein